MAASVAAGVEAEAAVVRDEKAAANAAKETKVALAVSGCRSRGRGSSIVVGREISMNTLGSS